MKESLCSEISGELATPSSGTTRLEAAVPGRPCRAEGVTHRLAVWWGLAAEHFREIIQLAPHLTEKRGPERPGDRPRPHVSSWQTQNGNGAFVL